MPTQRHNQAGVLRGDGAARLPILGNVVQF